MSASGICEFDVAGLFQRDHRRLTLVASSMHVSHCLALFASCPMRSCSRAKREAWWLKTSLWALAIAMDDALCVSYHQTSALKLLVFVQLSCLPLFLLRPCETDIGDASQGVGHGVRHAPAAGATRCCADDGARSGFGRPGISLRLRCGPCVLAVPCEVIHLQADRWGGGCVYLRVFVTV